MADRAAGEAPPICAPRRGTAGLAPGGASSNAASRTGISAASTDRVARRRESTWPARSEARAAGDAWMFLLRSNCSPAETREACWEASWDLKAAAPSGAMARTSTRSAPEPNPAITTGA